MKKKVEFNGKPANVEFTYSYGEMISLSNKKVKRPWGTVPERIETRKALFNINGRTYEGTRTFKVAGGPYTEIFEFDGNKFYSHKKVIEYILKNNK